MEIPFYVEINSEKVNRKIVSLKEVPSLVRQYAAHRIQLYMSYYLFDAEIKKHKEERDMKTLRTYPGNVYFRKLIVDIDKGKDTPEFVLRRAREFCFRINNEYDVSYDSMEYYFSGTGYHIALPNMFKFDPSPSLPQLIKYNFRRLIPEGDENVWASASSMIRVPNTYNEKAQLYKIPLTREEFFNGSIEDFQREAKEPRLDFKWELEPFDGDYTNLIIGLPQKLLSIPEEKPEESTIATCVSNMYHEGPTKGKRHNKILRIASAWRRAGIPRVAVTKIVVDWADNMEPFESKRLVDNTYDNNYTYSCSDSLMSEYCSDKCIFYKKKNYAIDLIDANSAEKTFVERIRSNYGERSFNLNTVFPARYDYSFEPGEVFGIQGPTKIGKSALIQNILVKLDNMQSVYCTFENHLHLAYRRFIQIAHGMTKDQVNAYYKHHNNSLSQRINHIKMLTVPPTVDQLEKMIIDYRPQIVIIDTLDGLDVPNVNDITTKTGILAPRLKEVAQRHDIIIGCVLHVGKAASQLDYKGNEQPLNVHSSLGSSAVAQKFDKILSWEGQRESVYRTLTASASRDEGEMKLNIKFNPITFKMELI